MGKPELITIWSFSKQRSHELTIAFLWFIFGWGEIRLNLIFIVLQNWKSKSEKWKMKACVQLSFFRKLTNDKLKFVFNFHFFQWKQTWQFNVIFFHRQKKIFCAHEPQLIMAKQLSTATTPFCFGFYQCCVDCRVKFDVVRSALQNSVFANVLTG